MTSKFPDDLRANESATRFIQMKDSDIERIMELLPGEGKTPPEIPAASPESCARWKELDGIARMMRDEPAVDLPVGLEERVMARVRSRRTPWWKNVGEVLLRPRTASVDPLKALRYPVSGQECSFYFIMVGVFYAVLSIVLMIGFHVLGTTLSPPGWVRWQPQIALVTALCMAAMGFYLLKDGILALRIARIVAFVYMGFALLNGVVVPLKWNMPLSAYTALISALIGVPTGFFLIRTIQNYGKRYAKV
jgi:hypothetical protein